MEGAWKRRVSGFLLFARTPFIQAHAHGAVLGMRGVLGGYGKIPVGYYLDLCADLGCLDKPIE